MTQPSPNRVLVLGRLPEVLQGVVKQLMDRGVTVRGSTDPERAADEFDAREFDLICFGSAIVGSLNERLRLEFTRQNPHVQFLDAFAPVAVRQIISTLRGANQRQKYIADFHVDEDGSDYLVKATILEPCAMSIEVYRTFGAPPPAVELIDTSFVVPGPFERRVEARYRIHGHMLLMMLNDDEYCLYRMQAGRAG